MLEIKGKYNMTKVFTDNIDNETISQIVNLLNQDFTKNCCVRIMPDCHSGKGCVIGFTANLGNKVIPNLVGVDIGCGMLTVNLGKVNINLEKLDDIIHEYIPAGFNVHNAPIADFPKLTELHCYKNLKNVQWIKNSLGTLGGGNHFIEVDVDSDENKYLVIHSGSRNLGQQVATYYQDLAVEICKGKQEYDDKKKEIIKTYKEQGRQQEIQQALLELEKEYEEKQPTYPKELCYLTGQYRVMYLHDMKLCQEYATLNRETMADIILYRIFNKKLKDYSYFHTVHNYINFNDNIIRKGAISSYKDELVLIPINMRDGSILAKGKGNPDWNYSAPHGTGRLMSRGKAKERFSLEEFKEVMKGIYTTSVNESTIDESPMVYKPIEEIINNIGDTVEIIDTIKPIYNFKSN